MKADSKTQPVLILNILKKFFILTLFLTGIRSVNAQSHSDSLVTVKRDTFILVVNGMEEGPDADVYVFAEEMPRFQGGGIENFRVYLMENLTIPPDSVVLGDGLPPTSYIQFVVDTSGVVRDVKAIRPGHPFVDAAVIRIVELSPPWTPGRQKGEPVDVMFTLPVHIHWQW